ncbi:uncharacterized protein G2W53_004485 [Senna tora]|uniref:Uncharacterized protein n=1 Tax=Senna tora TaxID=362788 RepID=A0A834XCD2_9FABA|nr:uncharacterized protein G2W53_004485 [Senna tora]
MEGGEERKDKDGRRRRATLL